MSGQIELTRAAVVQRTEKMLEVVAATVVVGLKIIEGKIEKKHSWGIHPDCTPWFAVVRAVSGSLPYRLAQICQKPLLGITALLHTMISQSVTGVWLCRSGQ